MDGWTGDEWTGGQVNGGLVRFWRLVHAEIQRVYDANQQVYGVRKVWRQLTRDGIVAPHCAIERLMRGRRLQGAVRSRRVRTTIPELAADRPLDLVTHDFAATRPN